MTNRTKLIDIIDDVNFMIVKFVDQIDPQRIDEWETYVRNCETIVTNEDNLRVGSEIQYDEDEVFGHWERILQSVLTNQKKSV